jgi:p55-binding region of Methyl-CpG-binding domain proteins MBD
VTVIKMPEGKVKPELKHGTQEKPKQLFWEKRLEVRLNEVRRKSSKNQLLLVEFPSLRQRRDGIHAD